MKKVELTLDECLILWDTWRNWNNIKDPDFWAFWFGYKDLSDDTQISIDKCKYFMKLMRNNNIGFLDSCTDEKGNFYGRGTYMYKDMIGFEWSEICTVNPNLLKDVVL